MSLLRRGLFADYFTQIKAGQNVGPVAVAVAVITLVGAFRMPAERSLIEQYQDYVRAAEAAFDAAERAADRADAEVTDETQSVHRNDEATFRLRAAWNALHDARNAHY
jgi:hypothetical protein